LGTTERYKKIVKWHKIIASITLALLNTINGEPTIQISLIGGINRKKDKIIDLGYKFGKVESGVLGLISQSLGEDGRYKLVSIHKWNDIMDNEIKEPYGIVDSLFDNLTSFDYELMELHSRVTAKIKEETDLILQPEQPQ